MAAGRGLRMGGTVPKQYLDLCGKPVLCRTLEAFEKSCVDDIVLVCPAGDEEYVNRTIVPGFTKVTGTVSGGSERFASCRNGVFAAMEGNPDFILIHDGVRALITPELIDRMIDELTHYPACCMAVPMTDTVRTVDADGMAVGTPNRSTLRRIQTPQGFKAGLIYEAYVKFDEELSCGTVSTEGITDDAMLAERYMNEKIRIVEGSYENIKITTPGDMLFAEAVIGRRIRNT